MKRVLLPLLLVTLIFIGMVSIPKLLYTSPCENLKNISNKPDILIMILDKLTFFVTYPTYLSKFESVQYSPLYPIRDFDDIFTLNNPDNNI